MNKKKMRNETGKKALTWVSISLILALAVIFCGCGVPGTGPEAPANHLKASLNGQEQVVTKFVYSLEMMGMIEVFASNTATDTTNLTDMWMVMAMQFTDLDGNLHITGSVMYYATKDDYYVCQSPQFTITSWGGKKGDLIQGSFTGSLTHYQVVNQQLVTLESDIPLSGEFKDTEDF
jgi:hypothetical protein